MSSFFGCFLASLLMSLSGRVFSVGPEQAEPDRAPSSAVGAPLPVRPLAVTNGVLRYVSDGEEVCLYGANYYAEDGSHWVSQGELTDQDRERIDQDLDDMVSMGVDIIRFHMFDTELSDAAGNLLPDCPYFDKYDYIIKACSDRGLYVYLTPIAIFNGRTGSYDDSFCSFIPRPAIVMWEDMWPAQTNYLYQVLTRTNPYTGNRLVDEPNVAIIELVNEPDYCSLEEIQTGAFRYNWVGADRGEAAMAALQSAWQAYAPARLQDSLEFFAQWRYKLLRRYLEQMIETVKSTEPVTWKPLAFNRPWVAGDELHVAIAESGIEILTLPAYSDVFDHVLDDDTNQLLHLKQWNHFKNPLPECYRNMARVVYEFDGPQTVNQIEMVPAITRQKRWQGTQIMCYFQYDPLSGTHSNQAWPDHYLNLWHTPERAVAYMIGREYFHRKPRGLESGGVISVDFYKDTYPYVDTALFQGVVSDSAWAEINPQGPGTYSFQNLDGSTLDIETYSSSVMNGSDNGWRKYPNFSGVLAGTGDPATVTLSEIPYDNYYVVVYLSGWYSGYKGAFSDGTTTKYANFVSVTPGQMVEGADMDSSDGCDPGSYVVFGSEDSPLTSDTLTLTATKISGAVSIGGFQVVEIVNPEMPDDDWVFSPAAVSHARNAALLCDDDIFMSARETDWVPLDVPKSPKRIACVGNSPYFNYSGTGVVDVHVNVDELDLRFYPDVERCRYALSGTDSDPLTVLHSNTNRFELLLPDWKGADAQHLADGEWQSIGSFDGALDVVPGQYRLVRSPMMLTTDKLQAYVEQFNADDNELYTNAVPNAQAFEFLEENIPLFECPDEDFERTWYFRWWTYRKHVKQTPDGCVISEFLPDVPWSGKYNTISCPVGHHFYEGRWLHNSEYLDDYSVFWFRKGGAPRLYSCWLTDALYARYLVQPDADLLTDLLPDLIENYRQWESEHRQENGLFYQTDDRDGGELSIGGSGFRPPLHSYMYADTRAIASIAALAGLDDTAAEFTAESEEIRSLVLSNLWDSTAEFFKVLPVDTNQLVDVREEHGYVPWYFNLPPTNQGYEAAWAQLMNPEGFYAPYGPTTAEQRHPEFVISYEGHECQWNGPSWPLATSITLTGLANVLNNYEQDVVSKADYFETLSIYTHCHQLELDGKTVPWIDENINPFTGDWISRTRLMTWDDGTWSDGKGGEERGKDYNHSTYNDLIITGLVGLRPRADNVVEVNPLLPADTWDFFCLDNILYHGHILTVLWDKTGEKYGKGAGLKVFADGKCIGESETLSRVTGLLE